MKFNRGLTKLQGNIATVNPDLTVNPEAFLTVKVENLHGAVSHFKHPTYMYAVALARLGILRLQPWNQRKE